MNKQSSIKSLFLVFTITCGVYGEDEADIRQLVTSNLAAGKKIPIVIIQGTVEVSTGVFQNFRYSKSGTRFLFEGDMEPKFEGNDLDSMKSEKSREAFRARLAKRKSLLGNPSPDWLLFTGNQLAEYSQMSLTFLVQNKTDPPDFSHIRYLDPKKWGCISGIPIELLLPQMKLSVTEEGAIFSFQGGAASKEKICSNMEVVVSKQYGWNVSKVKFWGGRAGEHENQLQWQRQDNYWFPKTGVTRIGKKVDIKWEIQSISFDHKDLKTDFKIHEERLSGIMKYEGAPGTKQVQTILGGADGERQYRLLKAEQFLE